MPTPPRLCDPTLSLLIMAARHCAWGASLQRASSHKEACRGAARSFRPEAARATAHRSVARMVHGACAVGSRGCHPAVILLPPCRHPAAILPPSCRRPAHTAEAIGICGPGCGFAACAACAAMAGGRCGPTRAIAEASFPMPPPIVSCATSSRRSPNGLWRT